jgi:hypothetical protein
VPRLLEMEETAAFAVLMRRLNGKPPVADLFGVKGRKWLRELELPVEEAQTVESRCATSSSSTKR